MVSPEDHNQSVWNEFLQQKQTLPTENRDYKEWHRGRKKFAVWTIDIQSQPVQSRFDAARAHLAEFLFKPYQRQPHITLFVGGFLAEVERFEDDYTFEDIDYCLRQLREAKLSPFQIAIGGINSFAAAPFFEVFDLSGGIERIRNVLSDTRFEIREAKYIPHLTIGLYSGPFQTKTVVEKISSFYPESPISHCVDKISLITYSAYKIAGPLVVEYAFDLRS